MADDKQKAAAKAAKSEERAAKRAKRKQTWSQFWQAFNLQRKQDKKLLPLMILSIVGVAALFFLIGLIWGGQWYMLPLGIGLGIVLAMYIFSRRLETSMYDRVGDQPGAAGWALDNLRNTVGIVWHSKQGVAMNRSLSAIVHRVVGNPGVVLVAEGSPTAAKELVNQQKRRLDRLAGDVPVYEIYVGDGEGQVPLKNLQRELLKLPRNYKKNEVASLAARIEAMDHIGNGPGAALPKGPLPKGAKMSGMNRRARRQSERKGEQ